MNTGLDGFRILPFRAWWPVGFGAVAGLLLRLVFSGTSGNPYGAMMGSFILGAPVLVSVVTVYLAERAARRTWGYYFVAPFVANVLFVVGTQAPGAATRYPMHNVVGMRADEARTLLARDDVRLLTVQADHGPAGVVLKESGFDADGTYGPGSQIVLLVGGGN